MGKLLLVILVLVLAVGVYLLFLKPGAGGLGSLGNLGALIPRGISIPKLPSLPSSAPSVTPSVRPTPTTGVNLTGLLQSLLGGGQVNGSALFVAILTFVAFLYATYKSERPAVKYAIPVLAGIVSYFTLGVVLGPQLTPVGATSAPNMARAQELIGVSNGVQALIVAAAVLVGFRALGGWDFLKTLWLAFGLVILVILGLTLVAVFIYGIDPATIVVSPAKLLAFLYSIVIKILQSWTKISG